MRGTFIIIWLTILLIQCNKGLSPEPETFPSSGVSGTVFFSHWPPADSLFDLRLILFQNYPPTSIIDEIFSGRAVVFPGINDNFRIPLNIDTFVYLIEAPPTIYQFFAVAQQYGPNISEDWRVVGQYDTTPEDTLPSPVIIEPGQIVENLYIYVDFDSIP